MRLFLNADAPASAPVEVPPSAEPKPEVKADEPKSYEVKVNGKVKTLTEAEFKKYAQLGLSANEKFELAAKEKAEAARIKAELESSDWFENIKKKFSDPKERRRILEDKLLEIVEEETLDPKEKEYRDLKAKEEARRKEEEENKKKDEDSKRQAEVKKQMERVQTEITDALDKTQLPKSLLFVKQTAQEMLSAEMHGVDLSPADAAKIVEKEYFEGISSVLPELPVSRIKEILGEKILAALREDSISGIKSQKPFEAKTSNQAPKPKPKKAAPSEKVPMSQYFRSLRMNKE